MINNEDNDWTFYAVYGLRMVRILILLSLLLSFFVMFTAIFHANICPSIYIIYDILAVLSTRYFCLQVSSSRASKECRVFWLKLPYFVLCARCILHTTLGFLNFYHFNFICIKVFILECFWSWFSFLRLLSSRTSHVGSLDLGFFLVRMWRREWMSEWRNYGLWSCETLQRWLSMELYWWITCSALEGGRAVISRALIDSSQSSFM